jgi:hypothetical protein
LPALALRALRRSLDLRLAALAWAAIAFLAGGFAETYLAWQVALLLCVCIAALAVSSAQGTRSLLMLAGAGLAGSAAAGILVYLAPGNDVRRAELPAALPPADVLSGSLAGARELTLELVQQPEAWLAAAAAGVIAFALAPSGRSLIGDPVIVVAAIVGLAVCCYFLVATTFAPSYYVTRFAPPARAQATSVLSVLLFMVCAGAISGAAARAWLVPADEEAGGLASAATVGSLLLLLLLTAAVVLPGLGGQLDERRQASRQAQQWDRRDREIEAGRSSGAEPVLVEALELRGGIVDITSDSSGWTNQCMAGYYNLKSLRAR